MCSRDLVAAALARGAGAFDAACEAVSTHGALADAWPTAGRALTAGALAAAAAG
jgi:NAD(P)H-hydrate repair Nnr-like enzyme with NAD(P)H-hydrate dehydratase domain